MFCRDYSFVTAARCVLAEFDADLDIRIEQHKSTPTITMRGFPIHEVSLESLSDVYKFIESIRPWIALYRGWYGEIPGIVYG